MSLCTSSSPEWWETPPPPPLQACTEMSLASQFPDVAKISSHIPLSVLKSQLSVSLSFLLVGLSFDPITFKSLCLRTFAF